MSEDLEATTAMCTHCCDVLTAHFSNTDVALIPKLDATDLVIVGGMFVTLNIVDSSRRKQLRGCIGHLSALPLNALSKYVLMSAFDDTRFSPLKETELANLEVAISLLVKYEPANNYLDWEVMSSLSFWFSSFSMSIVFCIYNVMCRSERMES